MCRCANDFSVKFGGKRDRFQMCRFQMCKRLFNAIDFAFSAFTDMILSVFNFKKTGVQLLISKKCKPLIIKDDLFMFDNLLIVVEIKALIISGIYFEKNASVYTFKS